VLHDPNERRGRAARKSHTQSPRWKPVKDFPVPDVRRAREAPTPLSEPFEMRDRKIPPLPDARRARENRKRVARFSHDISLEGDLSRRSVARRSGRCRKMTLHPQGFPLKGPPALPDRRKNVRETAWGILP